MVSTVYITDCWRGLDVTNRYASALTKSVSPSSRCENNYLAHRFGEEPDDFIIIIIITHASQGAKIRLRLGGSFAVEVRTWEEIILLE